MIGYAIAPALIKPEPKSEATAPVKSKQHTGIGPFLQSGKLRNDQCHSTEPFPRAQDEHEVRRIPQTLDKPADLGHSQEIPGTPIVSSNTTRAAVIQ
jgi:hypothetical protein